ncbi:MAG: FapA family protein [bacterium]
MNPKKEIPAIKTEREDLEQILEQIGPAIIKRALPKVEFSENQVMAYLVIPRPTITGEEATFEDCFKVLNSAGVKNINEIAIKKALNNRTFEKQILIAEGVAPQPGKDGYLAYRCGSQEGAKAFPGQLLATRVPAEEGKGGEKVTGEPIPPPPVYEAKIITGPGAALSKDGLHLWATKEGEIIWEGNRVCVEAVHHLKGSSLAKGGDFTGRVVVEEGMKNVSLSATSEIEVKGDVEMVTLKSSAGIKIKGNISRSKAEAKGDILAASAREADIETLGNVVIAEIRDCQVKAGKKVVALGPKGVIAGGSITAGEEINARTVGEDGHTAAQLTVEAGGKIAVEGFLHEGTKVNVGEIRMDVDRLMKGVSLGQGKEEKIVIWEYEPPRLRRTVLKPSKEGYTPTPAEILASIVLRTSSLEDGRKRAASLLNLPINEISWQELPGTGEIAEGRLLLIRFFPTTISYKPWEFEEERRRKKEAEEVLPAAVEHADGLYQLTNAEGGLFLTVFPPRGKGRSIPVEEVLSEIKRQAYIDINLELVKQAVLEKEAIPVRISHRQLDPKRDGRILIEFAPDMSRALATIYPPRQGGIAVGPDDVVDTLKQKGVVAGINKDKIKEIFLSKEFNTPIAVAEEIPPQPREADKIKYRVAIEPLPIKFIEDEYGRVNFKELNLIQNVEAGEVLAVRVKGGGGKPGQKITGQPIPPPPPEPMELPLGKNTRLSEDGDSILSQIDGQVIFVNERLNVEPLYEVKGDVDTGIGNIRFVGGVIVRGSVGDDFQIEAGSDIQIQGSVEGARLTAGGNIIIGAGVRGRSKAKLKAKGNVVAKFIENSRVQAEGNVIVHDGILHSRVDAGGMVALVGKRGAIIGGRVRAKKRISALRLGNRLFTSTKLEVDEHYQIKEQLQRLEKRLEKAKQDLKETKLGVVILERLKEKKGKFPPEKQEALIRMRAKANELTALIQRYIEQRIFLENRLGTYNQKESERIDVLNQIYPGVELTIRTETKHIKEAITEPITITLAGGKLRFGPYRG